MSRSVLKDIMMFVGGPAVQGEHFRNPDLEGLPVCGGEQGPGTECEGEGQGHGVPSKGDMKSPSRCISTQAYISSSSSRSDRFMLCQ